MSQVSEPLGPRCGPGGPLSHCAGQAAHAAAGPLALSRAVAPARSSREPARRRSLARRLARHRRPARRGGLARRSRPAICRRLAGGRGLARRRRWVCRRSPAVRASLAGRGGRPLRRVPGCGPPACARGLQARRFGPARAGPLRAALLAAGSGRCRHRGGPALRALARQVVLMILPGARGPAPRLAGRSDSRCLRHVMFLRE